MGTILIIVLLILLLGGGGYYGHSMYGGAGLGGILGLVLLVVVMFWVVGGLRIGWSVCSNLIFGRDRARQRQDGISFSRFRLMTHGMAMLAILLDGKGEINNLMPNDRAGVAPLTSRPLQNV
jgi:hypothetical protein